MRTAFYTLGCKVNQYETQSMIEDFRAGGFEVVSPQQQAELYVINSCTVTATGDKKTRQMIGHFKRQNPLAKVAVCGCLPQALGNSEVEKLLPGADIITGSKNRCDLLEAVRQAFSTNKRIITITEHQRGEPFEAMNITGFEERTRAYVKIEDGCERYCAYCIIPKARGSVRSKALQDLKDEITSLAEKGFWEVVLVGINLSCYGTDIGTTLLEACQTACSVEGIKRIRLGSLEPELLSEQTIIELAKLEKFCPQFHLSLQSGSDATLRRMNRHYNTTIYREIVTNIRRCFENAAITTDIMVGFPQESDKDFADSLEFCKELGLAKAHIFAYSRREGTVAWSMEGQIPEQEKARRSREMAKMAKLSRKTFLESQLGCTCEVLFETGNRGYTKNYTPVSVDSELDLSGQILPVRLDSLDGDGVKGSAFLEALPPNHRSRDRSLDNPII